MSSQAFNGNWGAGLGGLFWMKLFGFVSLETCLGFWHLPILTSAVGEFGQEFGELDGAVGVAFEALGMGSWRLGLILSISLTFLFLTTPTTAWFLYETHNEPDFWKKPSPNRLILLFCLAFYGALLILELSIVYQTIVENIAIQQTPNPLPLPDEDKPPSPVVIASLAFLMSIMGVVAGSAGSKLLIQIEHFNIFNQGRN